LSSEPTPPPEKPRLPPISLGGGWMFFCALIAIGCFAVATWMVAVRDTPISDPAVLIVAVGGLWFAGRTVMMMQKKP
jgi:hypothetical protein